MKPTKPSYEELEAELAQQKTKTHCAYCGEDFLLDTVTADQVGEHIQNCPKHPIADYKAKIASLQSRLKALEKVAEKMAEALEKLVKFNEELCEDVGISTHYPSADNARKLIEEFKSVTTANGLRSERESLA